MIDGRFPVVAADFPWPYKDKKTGGSHTSGSSQKYSTMDWDAVKAFPIHDILADNAVLFLWVTTPNKILIADVVNHWGLDYRTTIYWKKLTGGMGHWARGVVEEVWLLTRGKVKALKWQGKNVLQETADGFPVGWIYSRIANHSRKPEKALRMFEDMTEPFSARRVELFATQERPGWETVGHELGSDVFEFAEHCRLPLSYSKNTCSICGDSYGGLCSPEACNLKPDPGDITVKGSQLFDPYRARLEGQLKPFKQEAA